MHKKWLWQPLCLAFMSLLYLGGCGSASDVVIPLDRDGDGLMDEQEIQMGTEPDSADSDGDGFLDPDELKSFTNPRDPNDHPYTGGWPIDSCRHDIESTGNDVGSIAQNFELINQDGETVRLHDFCNQVVLLVSAAFW